MKKYILWLIVFIFILTGCSNLLNMNIKPTNIISEEDVKKDPALVNTFLSKIYNNVRWQGGARYLDYNALPVLAVCGGEGSVFAGWQPSYQAAINVMNENGAHSAIDYWPYIDIRSANEIIEILKSSTFEQQLVKEKTAEAKFLRAFMYFELVKRYGGVPLITVPQSIDQPLDELYVHRNSEKEIYDFIASEMDEIFSILPSSYSSDFGRATKWAAYALKSRAMLYAASVAQYGTIQLDGLLGIPQNEAASYWTKAYDASMEIINNSPHTLYVKNADPMKNYGEIFTIDGNSEVIFAEVYDLSLLKCHNWNRDGLPQMSSSVGANNMVIWEFAQKYEYMDGSSGKIDPLKLDGKYLFDINELMGKKDPRFRASVFYPESPWQGGVTYFHTNTIGVFAGSTWPLKGSARDIKQGLVVRKRMNEKLVSPPDLTDETDWIVFRTGEMYLNAAEAAFNLNNEPEARRLLNLIRQRAGMPDKPLITFDVIQNERAVELAYEEHRYWDLRRWRIAEAELNGKGFTKAVWVYNYTQKKYTMKPASADFGSVRSFTSRNYYFPLGKARLADNPNLVENPGY